MRRTKAGQPTLRLVFWLLVEVIMPIVVTIALLVAAVFGVVKLIQGVFT